MRTFLGLLFVALMITLFICGVVFAFWECVQVTEENKNTKGAQPPMKDRKYIFTEETKEICGHVLHRIQAVRDFSDVKAGDLGGWIESEKNLSHKGNCWVYGDALVYGNAMVYGDALIYENARIHKNAQIFSNARVFGDAQICGNAEIFGNATVCENAEIFGNAMVFWNTQVYGYAQIYGSAQIYENAQVYGYAQIYGDTRVYGNAQIYGDAWVCGAAVVYGDAQIYGNAMVYGVAVIRKDVKISNTTDIFVTGPIGSRHDYTTFTRYKDNDIFVFCGCFSGNIEEFEKAVFATHGDSEHGRNYLNAIALAKAILG